MGRRIVVAVLMMATGLALAQEAPPPLPTSDELHKQMDAGDYRGALKGLLRVLDLKGPAAAPYDRVEMQMLRAECLLQIRETKSCLDALDMARKDAVDKGNADGIGAALALSDLISHSPAMKYTPKTKTGPLAPKPIDILDRKARKDAYKALFTDELAVAQAKIREAQTAGNMPPIFDAAKLAATLRAIEKAGTGDTVESKKLAEDLSEHAVRLLSDSVSDFSGRVDYLSGQANAVVTIPVARYDPTSGRSWLDQVTQRRGLQADEARELQNIQQTTGQIISAASDLALALQSNVDDYRGVATSATAVQVKAAIVLGDNYAVVPK